MTVAQCGTAEMVSTLGWERNVASSCNIDMICPGSGIGQLLVVVGENLQEIKRDNGYVLVATKRQEVEIRGGRCF